MEELKKEVAALETLRARAALEVKSLSTERAKLAVAQKDADKEHAKRTRERKERMGRLLNQVLGAQTREREATDKLAAKRKELEEAVEAQVRAEVIKA